MDDCARPTAGVFNELHNPKCIDCLPTSQPTFLHWFLRDDSQRKNHAHLDAAKNYERCFAML
jgi:hypothetical protein